MQGAEEALRHENALRTIRYLKLRTVHYLKLRTVRYLTIGTARYLTRSGMRCTVCRALGGRCVA